MQQTAVSQKIKSEWTALKQTILMSRQKTEEPEEERLKKIEQKLRSGKRLTREELEFLKSRSPYLYQQAIRIQHMADGLKEQLKHCKTKQQAQQLISQTQAMVSAKDPMREAVLAALDRVKKEFTDSEYYKKLPADEEEKKKPEGTKDPFSDEEEDEVSYQYENTSCGYQMATQEGGTNESAFAAEA